MPLTSTDNKGTARIDSHPSADTSHTLTLAETSRARRQGRVECRALSPTGSSERAEFRSSPSSAHNIARLRPPEGPQRGNLFSSQPKIARFTSSGYSCCVQ